MKIRNYILAPFRVGVFLLLSFSAHAQIITTVAGDSLTGYNGDYIPATTATLSNPSGVAVDAAGNIYIADRNNNRIRKVNRSGIITTLAGTIVGISTAGFSGDGGPATAAQLNNPYCIALDTLGNIYFGDDANYRVRKIDTADIITTIAGNGTGGYNGDGIPATSAELDGIVGLAIDKYGAVYESDAGNNRIRKINPSGIITTIAGNDTCGHSGDGGLATAAELCSPYGIAIDEAGNLYISESGNKDVRKIDTAGIITTIAGNDTAGYNGDNIAATAAELYEPLGIAVDGSGNVYIGDTYNERVRKVDISGIITTIAGTGSSIYNGDNILATSANIDPIGVAIDHSGNVFSTDFDNDRIRRIGWPENINTLANIEEGVMVYPNPSHGSFTVNISSNTDEHANMIVTNMLGEKIKKITVGTNRPVIMQLDVAPGMYILSVNDGHNISTTKMVIQ